MTDLTINRGDIFSLLSTQRAIDEARLGSLRKGSVSVVNMRQVDDALRLHLAL